VSSAVKCLVRTDGEQSRVPYIAVEVSRGAASSFAYYDGQPAVTKFDHECPEVVSESATG
jgi:hypothetical protein